MGLVDLRDATITLRDGGSNFIALVIGEGNFSHTNRRNVEPVKSRGILDTVREGEEEVVDVNFQFVWTEITASADDPPTVEDVLYRTGEAADWVSTAPDANAPYSIDIEILLARPCPEFDDEKIVLAWFNLQELAHSLRDATIDCKGFCNITRPTVTRIPQ